MLQQIKVHLKQNLVFKSLHLVSVLCVNILLAYVLKAANNGLLFYNVAIFGFFNLILSAGIEGALTYFNASKKLQHTQLVNIAINWGLWLIVFFIAAISVNHYILHLSLNNSSFIFFALFVVGSMLISFFNSLFYSNNQVVLPNIVLVIANIIFIFTVLFLKDIVSTHYIIFLYFSFIFLQGISMALAYLYKHNCWHQIRLFSLPSIKIVLRYGLISLGANVLFYIVLKLDYLFVKTCTDATSLGNYVQASKLMQMLLLLPQMLAASIFPNTASNHINNKNWSSIFFKFIKKYFLLFIAIGLVFLIKGQDICTLVFGNSFNTMHIYILYLLPGIFALSCSTLLSAYFNGIKKNIYNVYAAIVAVFVMLLLTFVLKNKYSASVAAIISSTAYIAEALFCYIIFKLRAK